MTNNISLLRQVDRLREYLFVAVDTVKLAVVTGKLIYIISIALTVVVCTSVGLMIFVYLMW